MNEDLLGVKAAFQIQAAELQNMRTRLIGREDRVMNSH
jgi:hypothetical protein